MTNQEKLELLAVSQAELASARTALNAIDAQITKCQQSIALQEKEVTTSAAGGASWVSRRTAAEHSLVWLRSELRQLAAERTTANARVLAAERAVVQYGGAP